MSKLDDYHHVNNPLFITSIERAPGDRLDLGPANIRRRFDPRDNHPRRQPPGSQAVYEVRDGDLHLTYHHFEGWEPQGLDGVGQFGRLMVAVPDGDGVYHAREIMKLYKPEHRHGVVAPGFDFFIARWQQGQATDLLAVWIAGDPTPRLTDLAPIRYRPHSTGGGEDDDVTDSVTDSGVDVPDHLVIDPEEVLPARGFDDAISWSVTDSVRITGWSIDDDELRVDWTPVPPSWPRYEGGRFGALYAVVWTPGGRLRAGRIEHTREATELLGTTVGTWSDPPDNHIRLTETLTAKLSKFGEDIEISDVRQLVAVFLAGRDANLVRTELALRDGVTLAGAEPVDPDEPSDPEIEDSGDPETPDPETDPPDCDEQIRAAVAAARAADAAALEAIEARLRKPVAEGGAGVGGWSQMGIYQRIVQAPTMLRRGEQIIAEDLRPLLKAMKGER